MCVSVRAGKEFRERGSEDGRGEEEGKKGLGRGKDGGVDAELG